MFFLFCAGGCGSCYAFAATAMHEARVRILTNNKVTPVYSPQDVVDCSPYSEGTVCLDLTTLCYEYYYIAYRAQERQGYNNY